MWCFRSRVGVRSGGCMKRMHSLILATVLLLLVPTGAVTNGKQSTRPASPRSQDFVLLVHGGAGDYTHVPPEQIAVRRAAMTKAIEAGYKVLAHAGTSLDAVEATIRVLEDSG